jgi:AcrR family transcriptional regulator
MTLKERVKRRIAEHVEERVQATRERLLEAGKKLFAEHGFRHVTVRDIAREAEANIAAVNYHFGDKMQLYTSVLHAAVERVRAGIEASMRPAAGLPPEEQLRHYLHTSLVRMSMSEDTRTEMQRLFSHELMDPTPAGRVLADKMIKPRLEWLAQVIGAIMALPPADERVQRCVVSLQAQLVFQAASPARRIWFGAPRTPAELEQEIEHILEFSLAGIRAIAAGARSHKKR